MMHPRGVRHLHDPFRLVRNRKLIQFIKLLKHSLIQLMNQNQSNYLIARTELTAVSLCFILI